MRILALTILGLMVVGCEKTKIETKTKTQSPEEEKWTQEYETEFQMSEDENKRLKAEIESNKLKAEKNNISTNSPPKPTDQNGTKTTPRKLTAEEEKVVGTYEGKKDGFTFRVVFLPNGVCEGYANGKKQEGEATWKIVNREVHTIAKTGQIIIFRINKDSSITGIAGIIDEKREDVPEDKQSTFKKIK